MEASRVVTIWLQFGGRGGGSEKNETPHPLQDKGLRLKNKWRGRRVVLGTNENAGRELPDEILKAFKDWCASPEMQVMSASFGPLLTAN